MLNLEVVLLKQIRVDCRFFWPGFVSAHILRRFPCLAAKYEFIHDPINPEILFFSVFVDGKKHHTMPTPPDIGVPTVFLTGENVEPDLTRCDYAISFTHGLDEKHHIRIPNWVQRLNQIGFSPDHLINRKFDINECRTKFCSFIFRNKVPLREEMFTALDGLQHVDAPGGSMNNMPCIGSTPLEKIDFMKNYRFNIAFENSSSRGYTTEKLPEALLAGTIPVYWGDPEVEHDFNPSSFLDLSRYSSVADLAEEIIRIDHDRSVYKQIRNEPVFKDNQLPECANQDRTLAFFERFLG